MHDPGLELLGHLLEASHDLAPDALVAAVTRAGKALDAEDVAVRNRQILWIAAESMITRRPW